jgi:tetratricopeptide (TPR) repeat protein
MRIQSRSRQFSFAAVCIVFVGLYSYLAFRAYYASRLVAVPDQGNLQEAIRLEPANAEYRELLGRYLAFSGQNVDDAISNYQAAVHLNPYAARYWLDLASAYQVNNRTSEQRDSLERAVAADPTTPHVAWEAANFFLVQGDREKALHQFRVVLANDPERVGLALQLCWRATEDANQILNEALPKRADLYFSFLRLLIHKQETAAAKNVWNRLVTLNQTFSLPLAFPYFRFLLAQQEVAAAQNAWHQLASLNPSLQPYLPSRENLIINAGFEENVLNGGFDWSYLANSHVALAIDTGEFHSGTRSLSIIFDGQNPPDAGIFQFIPVKPNTEYEFSAAYKTEDLITASGPRFSIADAYINASYVLTDDSLGTNPWRLQQARFQSGPNTNLLLLKISRQPAGPLIRGKFWIDDLRLAEK